MYNLILSDNAETKWVEICAWCDPDKIVTKRYICEGYKATHGICEDHRNKVIQEYMEHYEKNGFKIVDDDDHSNGERLSIICGIEPR